MAKEFVFQGREIMVILRNRKFHCIQEPQRGTVRSEDTDREGICEPCGFKDSEFISRASRAALSSADPTSSYFHVN